MVKRINLKVLAVVCLILSIQSTAFAKRGIFNFSVDKIPAYNIPNFVPTNNDKIELLYFGGPIIPEVKIVSVHWSNSVHPIIMKEMASFYSAFVASSQLSWLGEYNTQIKSVDGRDGSNQIFGKGSFHSEIVINPKNTSRTLTDEDIKAELAYQISQNILPRPDANTLFSIHFPGNISISIEGMYSCRSFGGYHNFAEDKQFGTFFYTVLPDCAMRSADDEARLRNMTFVASHEVMEAVTDPIPTPGEHPAYPQAWNTSGGHEISDICVYKSTSIDGPNRSYTVTTNWSNQRQACYDGK